MSRPSEPDRRTILSAGVGLPLLWLRPRRAATLDPVALAARLGTSSSAEARTLVAAAMRDGLTREGLTGAVLLAALTDIPPLPLGGPLHAAMVIESAAQWTDRAPERERWLAALWCLEDYLGYRDRVRAAGTWRLPDPPQPDTQLPGARPRDARPELVGALEEWNLSSAELALQSLSGSTRAERFELLRQASFRCFAGLGHKLLYAVQLERVLERVDQRLVEPALRSLLRCLLHPSAERDTAAYALANELASELPADWERQADDQDALPTLVRSLRALSPAESQAALVRAIRAGLGPQSAWDALRLAGTDSFLRRAPGARRRHLPVHTVTLMNAFDSARRRTPDPDVRARLVLTAAGWLAQLRSAGEQQAGPGTDDDGIFREDLPTPQTSTSALLRVATQDHHLKYAAAAREEAARAPLAYRSRILGAGFDYLPTGADLAPRAQLAEQVLERSGRG